MDSEQVICIDCQHENPIGSKFCLRCGKLIGQYCGYCQARLPLDAKFCNQCGHAVSLPPPVPDLFGSDSIAALKRGESVNLLELLEDFEVRLVDAAMQAADGNLSHAAKLLQIHRTTLYSRIQNRVQK